MKMTRKEWEAIEKNLKEWADSDILENAPRTWDDDGETIITMEEWEEVKQCILNPIDAALHLRGNRLYNYFAELWYTQREDDGLDAIVDRNDIPGLRFCDWLPRVYPFAAAALAADKEKRDFPGRGYIVLGRGVYGEYEVRFLREDVEGNFEGMDTLWRDKNHVAFGIEKGYSWSSGIVFGAIEAAQEFAEETNAMNYTAWERINEAPWEALGIDTEVEIPADVLLDACVGYLKGDTHAALALEIAKRGRILPNKDGVISSDGEWIFCPLRMGLR
jgi:hypothetical protein